ncbi:MAG: FtsX-like permease family protein, partial [Blastocatellia bacterium]
MPVSRDYQGNRRWSTVTVFGRLKSGISQQQAQFEMNAISERLEPEGRRFQGRGVNLVRLDREVGSGSRLGLMIMLGAVACVLLIACANIAGLLLSRTQEREKELGVRLALGATRGRILRQLLTESLLLSLIGGVAGTVLSVWIARAVVSLQPADIPRLDEVSTDTRVLLFALGLTALAGILFGLLPAIQFSRASVVVVLKQCSRLARRGGFLLQPRRVLLVGEVALALVLLVATGLLVRTFALLKSVNTGLETEGLLTLIVPLSETARYGSSKQQAGFARDLLNRVLAIPGVESAAVSNSIPMQDRYVLGMRLQIEGRLLPEDTT